MNLTTREAAMIDEYRTSEPDYIDESKLKNKKSARGIMWNMIDQFGGTEEEADESI